MLHAISTCSSFNLLTMLLCRQRPRCRHQITASRRILQVRRFLNLQGFDLCFRNDSIDATDSLYRRLPHSIVYVLVVFFTTTSPIAHTAQLPFAAFRNVFGIWKRFRLCGLSGHTFVHCVAISHVSSLLTHLAYSSWVDWYRARFPDAKPSSRMEAILLGQMLARVESYFAKNAEPYTEGTAKTSKQISPGSFDSLHEEVG